MKRLPVALALALAFSVATPARADWQEVSSKHFVVYSDDAPRRVAEYATKLERFDKALRATRGTPDEAVSPLARITVFIVPTVGAVQKLYRGSGEVAGFYIPRAARTVAFVPRTSGEDDFSAMTILLHEYSHHFMFSNYGGAVYPAWLIEGFAEFNSTASFGRDGSVLFGSAANFRANGMLEDGIMPLTRLVTASPDTVRDPRQTAIFYSRSWLLMHYMTMDSDRRVKLGAYFTALNAGTPPAEAAAQLGDPRKLDGQLNAYVQRPYLTGYTVVAARLAIEPVQVRALSPAEAAVMPARIASDRGVNAKTAPGVAELARRLAAPYPNDPAAQNVLAEAEFDARRYAAAEQAADRALAADPKSIHALIYKGLAREAAAVAAKATDTATWNTVRSWYVKANRLDPEYAYPLVLYYHAYDAARQEPTASARAGLLYAHDLAPFDVGLSMKTAAVLLGQNQPDKARPILKTVAYNPHAGRAATAAGALLATIDRGGAAEARGLIERGDGEKPDEAKTSR